MGKPIVVVGSYNAGLFIKGDRLPVMGETLIGHSFYEGAGGKGSNQALCTAKLGGDVRFVGCVGNDKYGRDALDIYREMGLSREFIFVDDTIHSGISFIVIDANGDNMISVVLGANDRLQPVHIDQAREVIAQSAVLACQLEGPIDTFIYALKLARSLGVTTLLDPAPARPLPAEAYENTDLILPNETEVEILTGIRVDTMERAIQAGNVLCERGVRTAIVKLGSRGSVLVDRHGARHYPAPQVESVDATGAGDAFAGGLMVAISEGKPLDEAIRFASCVAAFSVTQVGVVNALPSRAQVDAMLAKYTLAGSNEDRKS
ncbi:MAG: ribokinase [Sedimentisphaerales bacterium]|nr:ribokinase [Sedimentisphaerales bacterium]